MDLDGRTLGEFTLREKIGEGGFAVVHRAEQAGLEREAVVKVLRTKLAATPEVAQRFLREAKLASRIDHPYAAHVYAFGAEPDGVLWIAMELVRGTPMDKLLEAQGPLALEQLVPLFERICEVVQNAHEHGIVHRDLKPGNVMVLSRGGRLLPKLLDFGIARALDEVEPSSTQEIPALRGSDPINPQATTAWIEVDRGGTRRGQVMGSPSYMAPEQWIDAASVGPATDIYALGVVAFQALTARVPFTGTLEGVMHGHLEMPPPALGARFSPAVDAMIARALAKRPLDRYASANDLAAAMRAAAGLEDGVLPQLEPRIHDAMIAGAVQPLAEAVATLATARNLDQAATLLSDVATVAIRWVGILALASRSKIGPGRDTDSEAVRERLRQLGRGRLDDTAWLGLACDLTRPFADKRDAHPIPALVAMLHDADGVVAAFRHVHDLRAQLDRRVPRTSEERRAQYGEALITIARLLGTLEPLGDYTVVVPRAGRAERWRGVRRTPRTATAATSGLVDGRAVLVGRDDRAVLQLAPLVQVAAPAPGRDDEMFVLDGRGTRSARLVALPYGFERADPNLDDWLRTELDSQRDATTGGESDAPYRGLAPFTEEFAADYVGREREVEAFVNRLIAEPLLAVVGPSGAGKSSFVQAGVIPNMPASWRAIVVRPGASPLAALEAHLKAAGVDASDLRDDPRKLAEAMRAAAARESATIVLVVDQLEELFTLCRDDRERAAFAAALADATRTEIDPIRIVVTLRDDFLIRAAGMPVIGERLARGLELLSTPGPEDLERIIVEPARRAGYALEDPALATEMVDAVANQPGALALLSFTAAELWKLRDRHFHRLTREAYVAIGGVGGALARHAETMLSELSPEDQRLVRIAFRNLVTVEGTRQVLTVSELHQLLAPRTERARAEAVVDRLIAARLLVASEDAGGIARIEVIHEALLAAWPRLVEWRREDAEGARLRDQLRVAARQWDSRDRPRGLLWRDDALAEYRIWRARHPGMMTDVEEAFGRASLDDEARGRRIRRTLLGSAFLVLGIVAAILYQLRERATEQSTRAIAESARAEQEKTRAEAQKSLAERRENEMRVTNARSTVERDPTTTLGWLKHYPATGPSWGQVHELAIEAQHRGVAKHVLAGDAPKWAAFSSDDRLVTASVQSVQTWDAVTGRLLGKISHPVRFVEDSRQSFVLWPDGRSIAFVDERGDVFVADLPTGTPQKRMSERRGHLTVSADGRYLAAVGSKVQLFDRAQNRVRELRGHEGMVHAVAFSPDSTRLVTGGEDKTVRTWELRTGEGRIVVTYEARVVDAAIATDGEIAFSSDEALLLYSQGRSRVLYRGFIAMPPTFTPDGRILAADATTIRLWNRRGDELAVPGRRPPGNLVVFGFAVSRDHRTIVFTTPAGPHTLDLVTGDVHNLLGHRSVSASAVSPDGRRIAVADGDAMTRIWERDHGLAWTLGGHAAEVSTLAFAPDGATIVTASMDQTLRVWSVASHDHRVFGGHDSGIQAIAFSPDGKRIAATTFGSVVRVWDLATGTSRALLHRAAVEESAFSRDGTMLFTVGEDRVSIWNLATATVRVVAHPRVYALDISPDGRSLATASSDGSILIWDVATGTSRVFGNHGDAIAEIRYFADGTQLITRSGRNAKRHTIQGWDLKTGTGRVIYVDPSPMRAMAIAGDRLAIGTHVGQIRILGGAQPRELRSHDGKPIRALRFSPDGALLLSGGEDASVRLWVVATGASQIVHRHEGFVRNVVFSADGKRLGSSSNDHTAWVGDVDAEWCVEPTPKAVATRINQLTSVTIDSDQLNRGPSAAITPR